MNRYSSRKSALPADLMARPLSRRQFVQGLALTGLALGMGWPRSGAAAGAGPQPHAVPELQGSSLQSDSSSTCSRS